MSKLSDIDNLANRILSGNRAEASAGFATGTTTTLVKTTVVLPYVINGIWYSKAITDNQAVTGATVTGPLVGGGTYTQPAATTVYYVLSYNAAGTLYVTQGSYAGQSLGQPGAVGDGSIPDVQDLTLCPAGILKVVNTSLSANGGFRLGTDAIGIANTTATYFNIANLPSGLL